MKHRMKKLDTDKLSPVEVYKLVLSGKLKRFPLRFWQEDGTYENAAEIVRYLIEEVLKWKDEDVKAYFSAETLIKNRLRGMMSTCFGASPWRALEKAYPGRFLPWELSNTPNSFWTDENCRIATRWLLEKRLNWDPSNPSRKIALEDFIENGLHGMLAQRFENRPFKAINHLFPGRFREWEVTNLRQNFWNMERAAEAVRWLLEEKLKWSEEEILEKAMAQTFVENSLSVPIRDYFDGSVYKVIDMLYPGKYKPHDIKRKQDGYWTRESSIIAIRDLLDNKLKWSRDEIAQKLNSSTLRKNGLEHVCMKIFNGSTTAAVHAAYPGEFREWEFKNFKHIEWTREKVLEAVKWLIESKLKWSPEEVKTKLTLKTFYENDLYRVAEFFELNPAKAIMEAYPGKYLAWEFKKVPKGFWNQENAIKAVKWMIEEKLKWNDEDIRNKLSRKTFESCRLSGMIQVAFNKSTFLAIDAAYPGRFARKELKGKVPPSLDIRKAL